MKDRPSYRHLDIHTFKQADGQTVTLILCKYIGMRIAVDEKET
jgi:hypothetical protein